MRPAGGVPVQLAPSVRALLARLVAPFDRDLARALIEPRDVPVRLDSGPMLSPMQGSPEGVLLAIATYDPDRAAALADELPAPAATGPGARSTEARLRLAAYLVAEDEPRAQPFFGDRLTNRWYPGKPAGRDPGW